MATAVTTNQMSRQSSKCNVAGASEDAMENIGAEECRENKVYTINTIIDGI